ncbi:MAG: carbon starvation protein A [Phycisphaerae bacterium]|nr:carbon starvation protein A [Phycisphaerae bacterium]
MSALLTNSLVIAVLSGLGFIAAYRLYGKFIADRILGLDPSRSTPAHTKTDGIDYVPTHRAVLFGHHFASIAGLGPIVGPAIAVYWGWLPALLWVLFGCIFIGAVHDLATLYASLRHQGRGIGDLTNEVIGPRGRALFLIIIFFLLAMAMGVFALLMARLFTDLSPQAVMPTFSLIAIAVAIGLLVYRLKWRLGPVTVVGFALMLSTVFIGMKAPLPLYRLFVTDADAREAFATAGSAGDEQGCQLGSGGAREAVAYFESRAKADPGFQTAVEDVKQARETGMQAWTYLLLFYALVASILPVWLLLQPRDYINSFQLYLGLTLILLGLLVWHPSICVEAYKSVEPESGGALPLWPFLFITIACGAVSGFHNLVSSGTTARQISSEKDARIIGYGAMLMEGFLAVLVILACVVGTGDRFGEFYGDWPDSNAALGAFLTGAGHIISRPFTWVTRISDVSPALLESFCKSFIAVVVVSFAMTTLDSATRLLRFNIESIGKIVHLRVLQNRYVASLIAVIAIGYFALIRIGGKPAGVTLWQLFGTTNQLLAALGLLVVSVMLYKWGKPIVYTAVPLLLMLVSVSWAMAYKLSEFWHSYRQSISAGGPTDTGSLSLFIVGLCVLVLTAWLIVEGVIAFARHRPEEARGKRHEARGM